MMKVRLLRDARINHKAGEIVEVSPAELNFLVSVRSAEPLIETAVAEPIAETPEKPKRTRKKA